LGNDAGGHGSSQARRDSGARDAASRDAGPLVTAVALPGGPPGIGFDDVGYAPVLKKVIAPAGRSGNLDLVDPVTLEVTPIGGFSVSVGFTPGSHADGVTSADEGSGVLLALDRNAQEIRVVDPATRSIVFSTPLAGGADYVRSVGSTGEAWVTEPSKGQIEIFKVPAGSAPALSGSIAVTGGPEALVIDEARGRAYTNSFGGQTYAIDLAQRKIVETWKNGCALSLGLALDGARGFLFVACATGSVVVLDVAKGGTKLGELGQGAGLDILSFSPRLHHLYVPGATSGDLGIVGISAAGVPSLLGVVATAPGAQGVAADDFGNAWVCDPSGGRLLKVADRFAKTD
jgi:hypothetical protein